MNHSKKLNEMLDDAYETNDHANALSAVAATAIAEVERLEGLLDQISSADVADHWDYGVWMCEHLGDMEWGPPEPDPSDCRSKEVL